VAGLGCAAEPPDPGPPADPVSAIAQVERLADQMEGGEPVSRAEFDGALAPLRQELLSGWPEPELQTLLGALLRLKRALVNRFQVSDDNGLCSADSWSIYSACGPAARCLAAVELGELRCLWWLSGR
jgi:hypothetical protein